MEEDFGEELGDFVENEDQAVHRGKAFKWDIIATFSLVDALDYFNTKKDRGMVTIIALFFALSELFFVNSIITLDCWKQDNK
jgi:hypothetical protein